VTKPRNPVLVGSEFDVSVGPVESTALGFEEVGLTGLKMASSPPVPEAELELDSPESEVESC